MNQKTFLVSLALGVGTAVLSAYFVNKLNNAKTKTIVKK